jgi:hypothetical protein
VRRCSNLQPLVLALLTVGNAVTLAGCDESPRGGARRSEHALPQLQLSRLARASGDNLDLGQIQQIIADDSGNIYVADGPAREIAVLSGDGRRVRTIGRRGQGPGEFASLSSMNWSNELLAVLDVRLQRLTFFERAGGVAATKVLEGPFMQAGSPSVLAGGEVAYARVQRVNGASPEYLIISGITSVMVVPSIPEPPRSQGGVMCSTQDGSYFPGMPAPFNDSGSLRAFLPTGEIALAYQDAYMIDIYDVLTGQQRRSIKRAYSAVPLSDDDWENQPETQYFRALERQYGPLRHTTESRPCPYPELRPAFWPVIRAIVSDDMGRLWVESSSADESRSTLTLFSASGEPIGETTMPGWDRRVLPYARGNRFYFVTRDSLDVQSIEVYQLQVAAKS